MTAHETRLEDRVQTKLAEFVTDGVDILRCAAARTLGRIGQQAAAPALQKALLDEDADVRTDVMTGLVNLADPSTADAIMENFLGDPCPEVKLAAIEALAKLHHEPAYPYLIKLVTERDPEINWDEQSFFEDGWDDWLDVQFAAIKAVGDLGLEEAVPQILAAMNDEMGQDVTSVSIPALARLGDPGIEAINALLVDSDSRVRRRICEELVPGRSTKMDKALDRCLKDKDAEVRQNAFKTLLEYNSDDKRLAAFIRDEDADIRVMALEKIGDKYPSTIMESLQDNAAKVRQAAFRVIVRAPEKFAREGFSEIVQQSIGGNPAVGGDAAVAWASLIGEASAPSLGQALENDSQPEPFRLGLVESLGLLGEAGFSYLAKAAGDANRQVRLKALTLLAETAKNTPWPNKAGETLLAALNGDLVAAPEEPEQAEEAEQDIAVLDEPEVKEGGEEKEAVSTLEQLVNKGIQTESPESDPEDIEEVYLDEDDEHFINLSKLRALKKGKVSLDVEVAPHQDVRRFAARLLSDINRQGVVDALVETLGEDDVELKTAVLDSLACLAESGEKPGEKAADHILPEVSSVNATVRLLAVRCLGWIGGKDVVDTLKQLAAEKDTAIRQEAVRSLGRLGEAREILVESLNDEYPGVRITAARWLAQNPDKDTIKQLVALTCGFEGMHGQDVASFLKPGDVPEAVELYLKVLEDEESKRVWRIAIDALGEVLAGRGDASVSLAA